MNLRRKKFCSAKISDRKFRFLLIWRGFGRATAKRTSKSASGSNFAPDRLIQVAVGNVPLRAQVAAQRKGYRKKVCLSLERFCGVPKHSKIESGGTKIEAQRAPGRPRVPKTRPRRFQRPPRRRKTHTRCPKTRHRRPDRLQESSRPPLDLDFGSFGRRF